MFASVIILEVMVALGLTTLGMMQCLEPPSKIVQGGVQQLSIVELITMEIWYEGKEE